MKKAHYIFLLLALLLLTGCNDPKHVTDTLNRAEALMNEQPDSAWAVLNTIFPDEMGQKRNQALYALLYTQAQDKTYRDETNDSLISVAVDYYRQTDDVRHKFLSYYYKGRVHYNAKDYLNATSCYMEAEQLADEVGDDYLLGLLYGELGRIYDIYYDFPKSLEAYQKSAEHYEQAGKFRHRNYIWYNQSRVLRNMYEYDEAERLLRMALSLAKEEGDDVLKRCCLGSLVMLHIEHGQMAEAKSLYAELETLVDEDFGSSSFKCRIAEMYAVEKNFALANERIEKGWECAENRVDSVNLYLASSRIYSLQGNKELAYQNLLKGVNLQNRGVRQALQQPILTAQRDYLSEKLEFEAYRLRMEKQLRVLYILLFVLLLSVVVLFLSRKLKKEKEKARKTIDDLNREMLQKDNESRTKVVSLLKELENKDKETSSAICQLRNELQNQEENYRRYMEETEQFLHDMQDSLQEKSLRATGMFRNTISTMGEILSDFDHIKAPNTRLESIIKHWKKDYFVGNKALDNLEGLVNEFYDDAMYHFRKEVHLSSKEDYQQACCLFAGISIRTVACLMGKNEKGLYQWRLRLREKIESSSAEHKELFISLLGK